MASLRDIRRRIGSVKNTRKITRAMKLVAGAKMRKAEQAARAAQPYQNTLRSVLTRVIASEDSIEHQLLSIPDNTSDILIVVHSSDRGLCGSFNGQIAKFAIAQKAAYEAEGKNVHFLAFGRKVISSLKSANCSASDSQSLNPFSSTSALMVSGRACLDSWPTSMRRLLSIN